MAAPLARELLSGAPSVTADKILGWRISIHRAEFSGSPGAGAGADLGDDDSFVGRFALSFLPSDSLKIDISVNYAKSELGTGLINPNLQLGLCKAGN